MCLRVGVVLALPRKHSSDQQLWTAITAATAADQQSKVWPTVDRLATSVAYPVQEREGEISPSLSGHHFLPFLHFSPFATLR